MHGDSDSWITTSTILQGLRRFENQDAWERLVSRFRRPLLDFAGAMRLGPLDAEDVAQESLVAFAQAFREGRYDRDRGRLRHWLFGIAHNQIQQHRRRDARRHRILAHTDEEVDALPDPTAERLWERAWERFVADTCLAQVRTEFQPTTFRAFEGVVLAERAPRDVAGDLGVDVKVVYNAKHRVLTRVRELREALERTEVS